MYNQLINKERPKPIKTRLSTISMGLSSSTDFAKLCIQVPIKPVKLYCQMSTRSRNHDKTFSFYRIFHMES